MERSIVLIKPDGVRRGLVGEIVRRLEMRGLKMAACKMMKMDRHLLEEWYSHHREKPFFEDLCRFMMAGSVVAMVWEGIEAVKVIRELCGATNCREATAGTIRGDLGMSQQQNVIHASDTVETAKKEMGLIFKKEEIFEYERADEKEVYGKEEQVTHATT